jgi:GT2 family glycosyltransferase
VLPYSVDGSEPEASLVIVAQSGLVFTRLCIESIFANTRTPRYEVIAVDNASSDGTSDYLRALADRLPLFHVISNSENRGFPAGVNQGLTASTGRTLVVLNNDTMLPPNWLVGLARHLNDGSVGLVGPVTNHAPNEAAVPAEYRTYGEFVAFASARAAHHAGRQADLRTLTMFCVGMQRTVYEMLGGLDERFDLGLFEDDDYAMRVQRAGWRTVCAEDVYVHHFGEASFGSLVPSGAYAELFEQNRLRFEKKWGRSWQPHRRRSDEEYELLAARICDTVDATAPPASIVLVVSKGDDALLEFSKCTGWHFPQSDDGVYAGHHPADSSEAIAHLESLRSRGANVLVIPSPSFWWLDYYRDFARYLDRRFRTLHSDESCVVLAWTG